VETSELSKRIHRSTNTIRNWTETYAEFLSVSISERASGSSRNFNDRDALILATIADLRDQGLTPNLVKKALKEGRLLDAIPPLSTRDEERARESISLIPVSELNRAFDQVRFIQEERDQLIHERDNLLEKSQGEAERYNSEIASLNRELGRLRGMLVAGAILGAILIIVLLISLIALIAGLVNY